MNKQLQFICAICTKEIEFPSAMLVHIAKSGKETKRWHYDCYMTQKGLKRIR
jgi:hypothetical protein